MPIPLDVQQLPEQLRGEASLATFKDVDTLAKSYVEAQKLIGTARLEAPSANWGPNEWNSFFAKIGRPETPDGYKLDTKTLGLPEGISIDPEKQKGVMQELHKLNLLPNQVEGVMKLYAKNIAEAHHASEESKKSSLASGMEALRAQHGDKLQAVIDMADGVLTQLGTPEFKEYLKSSGLANSPEMVNFLHNIATKVTEDHQRGGGTPPVAGSAGAAQQELQRLESDTEFQKAYNDRSHPNHQAAVDRILNLNRMIHTGKVPV